MSESYIRNSIHKNIVDTIKPYIEEGHIGDVFYCIMAIATKINVENAGVQVQTLPEEEEKCIKKSRRPVRTSELDPVPEEGEGCCG